MIVRRAIFADVTKGSQAKFEALRKRKQLMRDDQADRVSVLAETYGKMVFATAYRILGNADDAEDALQNVFVKLLTTGNGQHAREPVRDWGAYLRVAATRCALDLLRRRPKLRPESLDDVGDVAGPPERNPRQQATRRESAALLRQALASLPEMESRVFALRYFEEFSYEEIAAQLDLSPNAVGAHLYRARKRLQDLLGPVLSGENTRQTR